MSEQLDTTQTNENPGANEWIVAPGDMDAGRIADPKIAEDIAYEMKNDMDYAAYYGNQIRHEQAILDGVQEDMGAALASRNPGDPIPGNYRALEAKVGSQNAKLGNLYMARTSYESDAAKAYEAAVAAINDQKQ